MDEIAGLYTAEGTLLRMRKRRAQDRAKAVVKTACKQWRREIRNEDIQQKREEERAKRATRAEKRWLERSSTPGERQYVLE